MPEVLKHCQLTQFCLNSSKFVTESDGGRETNRERQRETDGQTQTDRERERNTERERESEREHQDTEKDSEKQRERETNRKREHRETVKQRDKQGQKPKASESSQGVRRRRARAVDGLRSILLRSSCCASFSDRRRKCSRRWQSL